MRIQSLVTIVILVLAQSAALRADQDRPIERVQFLVHPAPLPEPAMKYRLMPWAAEQTPGNAATLYLSAFGAAGELATEGALDRFDSLPLEQLPGSDARRLLDKFAATVALLDAGSHRSWCQWDPPTGEEGLNLQLPYLGPARLISGLLTTRARLEISESRFDDALHTMQISFGLSQHLNQPPALQSFVALAIRLAALAEVQELIQQPGAPNLYWALTNIPSTDEPRRVILQAETAALYRAFPPLRHPDDLSASQSREILLRLLDLHGNKDEAARALTLTLSMIQSYPDARRFLIAQRQISAIEVESMPANTAVLVYMLSEYQRQADEIDRCAGLPIWRASAALDPAVETNRDYPANPLLTVLPRQNEMAWFGLVERRLAMLQIVEAIRGYAAAHSGAPPASLDDLARQTPAPLDPCLGKPFDYSVNGASATLKSVVPLNTNPVFQTAIYQITIVR